MINEKQCTKILNSGDVKYVAEEVKQIREFLTRMATIEYEYFKKQQLNKAA